MQPSTAKPPIRLPRWKVSAGMSRAMRAASFVASGRDACP
jgi:hypothetical protein